MTRKKYTSGEMEKAAVLKNQIHCQIDPRESGIVIHVLSCGTLCCFVFVFKGRQALCGEEQEEREAGRDADAGLHHHP